MSGGLHERQVIRPHILIICRPQFLSYVILPSPSGLSKATFVVTFSITLLLSHKDPFT